jgi:hypothetical protein
MGIWEVIANWIFGVASGVGQVVDPWVDILITAIPQFNMDPIVDIVVKATPALGAVVPIGCWMGAIVWFMMYSEA